MINIPILGRLSLSDYLRIILAFAFLICEPILRIVFAILPLTWASEKVSKQLGKSFGPTSEIKELNKNGTFQDLDNDKEAFLKLHTTEQLVQHRGLPFQTHYVTTKDGYILALHRIPHSRAENIPTVKAKGKKKRELPEPKTARPVVLLWHGFLMCSEVWVSSPDFNESLAFVLAEAGYDVWLGNTRILS